MSVTFTDGIVYDDLLHYLGSVTIQLSCNNHITNISSSQNLFS